MSNVVIIPIHNQFELVKTCVTSVMLKTEDLQLILVNDGSTDKELNKWLIDMDYQYENITLLVNWKTLGFSNACNKGIDYAMQHFDFVCLCLLNSDTEIVTNNWFTIVANHYLQRSDVGVAGVMSNNAMSQTVKNVPEYLNRIDKKPTVYSHLVHGFCYFISRTLIETIGKLDEDEFPHYGSEDDYSLKSMKAKFQNIIVGSVFVKHVNEASYSTETRANYVKTSLPAFQNRWGKYYVDSCVRQGWRINDYLNKA